jgi:hypothetical protein
VFQVVIDVRTVAIALRGTVGAVVIPEIRGLICAVKTFRNRDITP